MSLRLLFFFLNAALLPFSVQAVVRRDTVISIHDRQVSIHYPKGKVSGTILMLPGWNFSREKTCENSSFCRKALEKGYVLICPEMGKSLYASAVFPETRKEWASYPQLSFITDTLQPQLQQLYHLLRKGDRNFVYGISTGSRGAALILENTSGIYKGGALLSGDYDPCLLKADNLMNGFYGPYAAHQSRWEGPDNPARQAGKLNVPVYIGHGQADVVVPPEQSRLFAETLKQKGTPVRFSFPEKAEHAFSYWDSETDAVLLFFESIR